MLAITSLSQNSAHAIELGMIDADTGYRPTGKSTLEIGSGVEVSSQNTVRLVFGLSTEGLESKDTHPFHRILPVEATLSFGANGNSILPQISLKTVAYEHLTRDGEYIDVLKLNLQRETELGIDFRAKVMAVGGKITGECPPGWQCCEFGQRSYPNVEPVLSIAGQLLGARFEKLVNDSHGDTKVAVELFNVELQTGLNIGFRHYDQSDVIDSLQWRIGGNISGGFEAKQDTHFIGDGRLTTSIALKFVNQLSVSLSGGLEGQFTSNDDEKDSYQKARYFGQLALVYTF